MAASNFVQFPLPLFLVKKAIRSVRDKAQWQDIQRSRRGFEYMVMKYDYKSKRCDYQTVTIDHCKAEWINPHKAPADKVLLYFHGGGYATGSVNTHRAMLTKLALAGNVRILSFEYRLAPENPYPAALEDAVLAYDWVLNNGFSPTGVSFGGDSAGGGLALATLLYLRDHQKPLPKCAILLSPWTDLTLSGPSFTGSHVDEPMLVKEAFHLWTKNYYTSHDPQTPYISPVFADFTGLPKLFIQVGTAEALLDDSLRVYDKAKAQNVDIQIEIYQDYFHVFQSFWRLLPEAKRAIKKLGGFVARELNNV